MLEYYNRELQFAREMGSEFAQAYPRIAARLGVEGLDCTDPYVERLLEGFAFLTARVQLKLDARHPEFVQHLLELIYPHFLRPVPSCAVVEFTAEESESSLQGGYRVRRGTSLRTPLGKGARSYCEFVTAHDVTLWPLSVARAEYLSGSGLLAAQGLLSDGRARAAIRLRLRSAPGVSLKSLRPESLTFFLQATPDFASRLYEQVMADCLGFHARSAHQGARMHVRRAASIRPVGLEDDEALLPVPRGGFQGYRLLQEYFALPERLLFFALDDLGDIFASCEGQELDIYLVLNRAQPALEKAVDANQFRLGCTPAVNLFPLAADRVHVSSTHTEMHLVADRNHPTDFEVFSIERLRAIGAGGETVDEIRPFYAANHRTDRGAPLMYYTMQRRPRLISKRQQQVGARTDYVGSECFISIVDTAQRPLRGDIRQIDAQTLCTNRDLPILLAWGQGSTDLLIAGGAPVKTVRCLCGPSTPRQSPAFGDTGWSLISHLSLNYLSLVERDPQAGAEMLRDMLSLYADPNSVTAARQVGGVQGVSYRPVVGRTPMAGPACYTRGLEITLTLDDVAFEGAGILPLAAVLERFFARYVSLNSFTRTRLRSAVRGEIKTWPLRLGSRQLI